jgi:hypothetical protein
VRAGAAAGRLASVGAACARLSSGRTGRRVPSREPRTLYGYVTRFSLCAEVLAPAATSRAAPPRSSAGCHNARALERPSTGSLR